MNWNFFESAHGKGEWNGAGVVVKRALAVVQIENPLRPLWNTTEVVDFLKEKYTERISSSYTRATIPHSFLCLLVDWRYRYRSC